MHTGRAEHICPLRSGTGQPLGIPRGLSPSLLPAARRQGAAPGIFAHLSTFKHAAGPRGGRPPCWPCAHSGQPPAFQRLCQTLLRHVGAGRHWGPLSEQLLISASVSIQPPTEMSQGLLRSVIGLSSVHGAATSRARAQESCLLSPTCTEFDCDNLSRQSFELLWRRGYCTCCLLSARKVNGGNLHY